MDIGKFKTIIETLEKIDKRKGELSDLGIDISGYDDDLFRVINYLLESCFECNGWIGWYCYENDFGRGSLTAQDEAGNPICRTVEELYELVTS